MMYFKDSAMPSGIHAGFIEHEELELTDQELARLKARARRAVTMDSDKPEQPRQLPPEYEREFLRQPKSTDYNEFLSGKGKQ